MDGVNNNWVNLFKFLLLNSINVHVHVDSCNTSKQNIENTLYNHV